MDIAFDNDAKFVKWIGKLPAADQESISLAIDQLETLGSLLGPPQTKPLGRGLHELRVHGKDAQYRIFFSMRDETAMILTFIKKTSPQAHDKAREEARRKM